MTEQDLSTQFDFSRERGFLPKTDPLSSFSLSLERENADQLLEWMMMARDLPHYLAQGTVRKKIESLPMLTLQSIAPEEYEYAMLLCSYFGPAYVFGERPIKPFVPRNIAVLWCRLSAIQERPSTLAYATFCMRNWRRLDPKGPIALGNLALIQTFLGGSDESGFILPHTEIEQKAGVVGIALWHALQAAYRCEVDAVGRFLAESALSLVSILATLRRLTELCDPYIYYIRVRPFLHWSKDNPAIPDGVVYEDCFGNIPQKERGETGAQSSVIPTIDTFLGITHPKDRLWHYLEEMKLYMPPKHRLFLGYFLIRHPGVLRCFVKEHRQLHDSFNQNVLNVYLFREFHRLHFVKPYIEDQQERMGNPTSVGTGGTPLSAYLRAHSENTLKALVA